MAKRPLATIAPRDSRTRDVTIQRDDPFSSPDLMQGVLDDIADPGNMAGGESLASGVTAKVGRAASPKAIELLQKLLGVPLVNAANPKQLFRVSSVEPANGIVRLHTNTGGRVLSNITDFVKAIKDGVLEEAGYVGKKDLGMFETAGDAGERIGKVTEVGPRGGTTTKVQRRPIPATATR